jgi:hypothetical protein
MTARTAARARRERLADEQAAKSPRAVLLTAPVAFGVARSAPKPPAPPAPTRTPKRSTLPDSFFNALRSV